MKTPTDSAIDSVIELLDAFRSEAELRWKGDASIPPLLDSLLAVKQALATDAHLFFPRSTSPSHNSIREHFYLCVACCQLLLAKLGEGPSEKCDDGASLATTSSMTPTTVESIPVDVAGCVAAKLASCIDQLKSAIQLSPNQQESWFQQRTTRSMLQWIREQHVSLVTGSDHPPSFARRLASFPFLGPIFWRCGSALESAYRTSVVEPIIRRRGELEARHRSQLIDKQLAADRGREAVTALVMGYGIIEMPNCLLHAIDAFKEADQDIPPELLKKAVTRRMKAILQLVHEASTENLLPPETAALFGQIRDRLTEETEIANEHTALMFEKLWNSAAFRADCRENRLEFQYYEFPSLIDEVFNNLHRIWEPGYTPSLLDRVAIRQYLGPRSYGILRMSTVNTAGLPPVTFADGTRRCCQRKSIFQMVDPSVVVFVLDVTLCNAPKLEGDTLRPIRHAIEMFRSILKYRAYARKPVVVLLTGITEFMALLRHAPPGRVLPDYKGPADETDAVLGHVLDQLLTANTDDKIVHPLLCDIYDPELVPRLAEVVRGAHLAAKACSA